MTRAHVPAALRRDVLERAEGRCEYCRYPQDAAMLAFEVEHIVAEKHGGATTADNLALACPYCNRHKDTDLGSLDPATGVLTPFFHPRTQDWQEHFALEGAVGGSGNGGNDRLVEALQRHGLSVPVTRAVETLGASLRTRTRRRGSDFAALVDSSGYVMIESIPLVAQKMPGKRRWPRPDSVLEKLRRGIIDDTAATVSPLDLEDWEISGDQEPEPDKEL